MVSNDRNITTKNKDRPRGLEGQDDARNRQGTQKTTYVLTIPPQW